MVTQRIERLTFSGKDEDFSYFAEQFEARMFLLGLDRVLLGRVIVPKAEPDDEDSLLTQTNAQTSVERKQYQVWCELIQCLDRKSVMIVRPYKPNGTKAWDILNEHYRSGEKPRVQMLMNKLTNIRLENESITNYLLRVEDLQYNLREVGEEISESMLCSIVMKGLTKEFEAFRTVMNFGMIEITFQKLKKDLVNFSNDQKVVYGDRGTTDREKAHQSSSRRGERTCFTCGKPGHVKAECKQTQRTCYNCKKPGHLSKDCRLKKQCDNCKRTGHVKAVCFSPGGGKHKPRGPAEAHSAGKKWNDGVSFTCMDEDKNLIDSFIIDSGCTNYMVNSKDLFT